jgi:hypothetical protein
VSERPFAILRPSCDLFWVLKDIHRFCRYFFSPSICPHEPRKKQKRNLEFHSLQLRLQMLPLPAHEPFHPLLVQSTMKATRYWYLYAYKVVHYKGPTRTCQPDSIEHGGFTLFVPFAAFGGARLMDGSFSLLLGAGANKREIRCNNQPL